MEGLTMFPLLISLLLIGRVITSADVCDVGKSIIDKIPSTLLNGTWIVGYTTPKNITSEYRCWTDVYTPRNDGGADIRSWATNPKTRETFKASGIATINGHFMKYTCARNPEWSATYEVLAWVPGMFQIGGGCMEVFGFNPVNWIAFPQFPPTEEMLNGAKDAINKTGLDFNKFALDCWAADKM